MAKIKNVSGDNRLVPWLDGRLVLAGQIVDVPDEDLDNYLIQPANWAPANTPASTAPTTETVVA